MRIYFLLILMAIGLSFSTAYFALNLEKNNFATQKDIAEIEAYQRNFETTTTPIINLDLSSMYPSRDFFQLLHPISIYSKNNETNQETFVSQPCNRPTERMSKLSFDKNEIWEDFRCLRIAKLPESFFQSPPLIHDSGISYAYFAYLSGREPFNTAEWVKSNINLFHVSELKLIPNSSLEGNFRILSRLQKADFGNIEAGERTIYSNEYYLVKKNKDHDIQYEVFNRGDFENYLKDKSYFVKAYKPGAQCFYREGSVCWERVTNNILEVYKQSSIVIFLVSMIVLFLIAIILFKKIKLQKYEEERKKHALRVLTHELRTPISNLLLQVEMINKQSDLLPSHILEDFLKMEGEVYRLKRLAEKSSSYLQTHEDRSLIALENFKIPSINQLISEMLEAYIGKNIAFSPLEIDISLRLDAYWLNICLKNLIENAFVHGVAPVAVMLSADKEFLRIDVSNGGACDYTTLAAMMNSDRVGKNSSGLGLGLSIVQRIITEMNGKITFSNNPTTFSLFLRRTV